MDNRPTVFIGSSSEGLAIAETIKKKFGSKAVVDIWNGGQVFGQGSAYLESLLTASSLYEFAILIFTSDDTTTSRDQTHASVRDNVLFEYGLFLGRLGPKRSYALVQDTLRIPSDLLGIHFNRFKLTSEGKLDRSFARTSNAIVNEILRRHANTVEFSQLPSTALAIGYFENFLSRVLDQLDNYQPLTIQLANQDKSPTQVRYKTFTLNIIIPDDLKLVELTTLKSLIKGLKQVTVTSDPGSSGALRDFPFYIQSKLGSNDSDHLELFDVPTTMKSARRAIQKIFPSTHIGKDDKHLLAEKREIANFERTLRFLLSENPIWESSVKYRYLSEFIPR
ncbi:conserved hypothetical protein [Burkholderiales bacterium 8X]|nr:conserved hypothetical protein [Burkholderiales bacterium 8X]